MNLFEKLNRLDDSVVESKRIVKNRKLTEGYRVDPKISEFNVGDRVAERYNDSEFNVGTIVEIKRDTEGTQYLVKWDYSDRESEEWLYGDVLSLWVEDETEYDYDDDIGEMLTESTEQYELSTLVKDSINHLVNDLGKDSMADDFGDDVCADLENNYDIDIPQNPVKYADWCDAVMSEVSRQLNNKDKESFFEGASEVYYLELFSKDGRTFEQSFSTYQEAEEEGNFSLENNPMTKEYIIYDKNHKRAKHKR